MNLEPAIFEKSRKRETNFRIEFRPEWIFNLLSLRDNLTVLTIDHLREHRNIPSNLVIVVVLVQTATGLQFDTAPSLKDVAWLTEAATNAGACTVGGGFLTAGNTRWTTLYVLSIRRTCCCGSQDRQHRKNNNRMRLRT